jgi:hypothetical protein
VSYLARPAPSMPMRRVAPHMDVSLWSPASTFATSRLELFTKSVTPNFRLPKEDPRCPPAWGRSGPLVRTAQCRAIIPPQKMKTISNKECLGEV